MKKLFLLVLVSMLVLFAQAQCQANFQYTLTGLNISLTSTSINAGSTLNSQTPTWDFGDGSPQITGNSTINHTYQNPGIYNVCIEIFTWPTSWTTCSSTHCDSVLVGNVSQSSWDCDGQGNCSDPGSGNGQYISLTDCQSFCGVTTVNKEYITKMGLLKKIDLLGKETEQKNQLLFYIYDDGTVEKKLIIE